MEVPEVEFLSSDFCRTRSNITMCCASGPLAPNELSTTIRQAIARQCLCGLRPLHDAVCADCRSGTLLSLPQLKSSLELNNLQGMGSPANADEADDSYRTLGVGRSLPGSHYTRQICTCGREGRGGHVLRGNEEALFASATDKLLLHNFRFHRSRHHSDVCVCIRSITRTIRNPGGSGHPDCGGGIRLALKFRASATTTAMTLIQTLLKRASGCSNEREISG
jgi:hypothetical protein